MPADTAGFYQSLLEGLGVVAFEWDRQAERFTYVSPRAEDVLGYPARHWIETPGFWAGVVHPDDSPAARAAAQAAGGTDVQYRARRADGSYRWLRDVRQPAADVRYVQGFLLDVSDQHAQKEAQLEHRLNLEETIADISRHLLSGAADLSHVVEVVGEAMQVSRSYVFRLYDDATRMSNTHEWCAPGVEAQIGLLQDLESSVFPWWMEKLHRNEAIAVARLDDLPAAAVAEREILAEQGIEAVIVVPIRLQDGSLYGFMGFDECRGVREWQAGDVRMMEVVSDLLARYFSAEQARLALQESEARYRTLMEHLPVGVYRTTASGDFLEGNPALTKLLGLRDVGELASYNVTDFYLDPVDRQNHLSHLSDDPTYGAIFPLRRQDGAVIWVQDYPLAVRDAQGAILSFDGVLIDITERHRAEETSQAEQNMRRAIEHATPAGVAVVDRTGQQLYVNPAFCAMLGWSEEELTGATPPFVYWPEEEYEAIQQAFTSVLEGDIPRNGFELRFQRRTGERFDVLILLAPLDQVDGVESGWLASVFDITERKAAEAEIARLNRDLEIRVAARTADLASANEQLRAEISERRRAEQALERMNTTLMHRNRELQDFAYVASHDLQEPLRKISSFADLLRSDHSDQFDEMGRVYVERMQEAALRMSTLLRDLLLFSRVSTQGQQFERTNLAEVVEDVLSDLELQIRDTAGRVEVGPLATIEADPTQVRQLLQNLIGNALKFHREGVPPVVHVEARVEADDEGRPVCRVSVQDNGIGFDEKYTERIFSPFQRLHGRGMYPGTGMGLAICRRIVERHNGTITAKSRLEQGTTFYIELPVQHAAA